MKKSFTILTGSVLMVSMLTACGASASKITNYIENFDFENAYEYYIDKVKNSDNQDEIDIEIENAMNNIYNSLTDKYSSNEIDNTSISYLEKLASEAAFYDSNEYYNFSNNKNMIDSSADSYENGMSEYEKENYSSAISYFKMVYEIDSLHYDDAVDKISECEELLSNQKKENIHNLIKDKKYSEARQEINSLSSTDSSLAEELFAELETAISSGIDDKINSYFSEFNYNGAYDYIYNLYEEYGFNNLKSRLDGLKDEFIAYSLSTAEENAADNNYEAASAVVQQTMNTIGEENEDLISAYNEYRLHLPIYIVDMSYMSCVNEVNKENTLEDNVGNMYHNGLFMCKSYYSGEGSAEYYIQGKYKSFSGTIAVPSGNESTDKTAYFEVYGDGKLLYTSPVMGKSSFPENFEIDVTGVKVLKISYPESNKKANMATIYDGLLSPEESNE